MLAAAEEEGGGDVSHSTIEKMRSRKREKATTTSILATNFAPYAVWAGIFLVPQVTLAMTPSAIDLPRLPQLTMSNELEMVTPSQVSSRVQEALRERDSIEATRSERYAEAKRQKNAEKEAKLREYDELFRKDQEERDEFYGKKVLEARRELEDVKREDRELLTKGMFRYSPFQIPEERDGEGGMEVVDSNTVQKEEGGVEVAKPEKAGSIASVRREEEELVRQRAEINAMKLRKAKEYNAQIKAEREEELRERSRERMEVVEAARESREQARFERRIEDIGKYVSRKEKMEEGKRERSLLK